MATDILQDPSELLDLERQRFDHYRRAMTAKLLELQDYVVGSLPEPNCDNGGYRMAEKSYDKAVALLSRMLEE